MPQNAQYATSNGQLLTADVGAKTVLNITAATVVKSTPGRVVKIYVNTAGSTAGSVSDCTTTGAVAAANLVCAIPNTVGILAISAPCALGITVTPGTGQVLSIAYS